MDDGPEALSDDERKRLDAADITSAPSHVAGDYPEWLDPHLTRIFGEARAEEGAALASRAPLDLRVNLLRAEREKAANMVSDLKAELSRWSPWGLRIRLGADAKSPAIHAEPAFLKGMIEVQDEGSKLAASPLSAAKPGEQVVDLCAGAGGKTLALAASMGNKGQIHATDRDGSTAHAERCQIGPRRRAQRSAASAARGHSCSRGSRRALRSCAYRCASTGIGTWRRNPDAKWRIRPGALDQRLKEQAEILDRAVPLLKAGGRIAYVTCSVLDEENSGRMGAAFSPATRSFRFSRRRTLPMRSATAPLCS